MAISVTATKTSDGCCFTYTPNPTDPKVWKYFPPAANAEISSGSDSPAGNTHSITLKGSLTHGQKFTCKVGTKAKPRTFEVTVS